MTDKILPGLMLVPALLLGSTTAVAGDRMSGDQLRALLTDATTYGQHARKSNITAHAYRRDDGTFVGAHSKKGARSGTWNVVGNEYCRHPKGEKNGCREVFDNGDGTYSLYKKAGSPMKPSRHVWNWVKVVPGNPENL